MKFNINHLTDSILDYMENNDLKNPNEFPALAFYKFIKESGISDSIKLRLTTDESGKFHVYQMKAGFSEHVFQFSIKDPAIPDAVIDEKNKPLYTRNEEPYHIIKLDSSNDTNSLRKKLLINRDDTKRIMYSDLLTNDMKKKKIDIYKVLSTCDTFSEICNNLENYSDMVRFDDKKLHELSQAIFSYERYQQEIGFHKENPNLPRPHFKDLENIVSSLMNLSEKTLHYAHRRNKSVDKITDIIAGRVGLSMPLLLLDGDNLHIHGINKNITLTEEILKNVNLGDSVINTIKKNIEAGTLDNIIDDIYKNHISEDFKAEYSLRLKMVTRQKSVEERLEHEDLNNFIDHMKTKYPYIFKDNELYSYKIGTLENKENYQSIADVLNTFKLNDTATQDCITVHYTDSHYLDSKDVGSITQNERYIRFIGETDAGVKSIISGFIEEVGDNSAMKVFNIRSLMMIDEANNPYNKMALEQLFSYCAKNKYALYLDKVYPEDDLPNIMPELLEMADNYKNKVYFIPSSQAFETIHEMASWKKDMTTFIKDKALKNKIS